MSGDVGEILVYSTALTDAQIKSVESYLYTKWVGGSLAANLKRYPDEVPAGSPTLPVVTDLNFHLDAEVLLPSSDGNRVYQWADRSDEKRSFWQADATRQPLLVPGVANGRPVVRFDGSNDRFNERITLAAKDNNQITVFAAVNPIFSITKSNVREHNK